jgi:carboxyl-terminal processing protease
VNPNTKIFLPLGFVATLLLGLLIGMQLNPIAGSKPGLFSDYEPSRLEQILRHIDYKYVDSVDTEAMMDTLVANYLDQEDVIDEIFNQLDPHSNYIPAEALKAETESLQGNFEGIGIEFNLVRDTILVVSPITGGPSEALGIQSGDKIITVEDSLVAGVNITDVQVINLLRGEEGTEVRIEIQRAGEEELIPYTIKRAKIPVYSVDVSYMVDDQVGYLKLNRFSANTLREFQDGLDKLIDDGMQSLILDLRGNPGGYLSAAVGIADELLSGDKLIVYTEGKASKKRNYKAQNRGAFERGKLLVLIDEGSASASEIVAGAVQDHQRGTIMGRRSFGKGLVQEIYPLMDESAIRLTIARYYTPNGRCIQRNYDQGTEAYYEQYLDRLQNGGEVSDSIRDLAALSYGIVPDFPLAIDTSDVRKTFLKVYNSGLVSRYAYDLYAREKSNLNNYSSVEEFVSGYSLPDGSFDELMDRVEKREIELDEQFVPDAQMALETAIKAQLGRQHWKSEGFYPVFHELDQDFQRAYQELKGSGSTVESRAEAATIVD